MSILHRALGLAVQRIVGDPRVRAKAAEVVERELKPRIKEAVERARPRLEAARDEIREIAKETDPKRDPAGFARKLGRRVGQITKGEKEN
jgi:hypothetical protein